MLVPILLVSGSVQFAEISPNGTAKEVIDKLTKLAEVRSDILGALEDRGWSLQEIKRQRSGRPWEEQDLEGLGDGLSRLFALSTWPSLANHVVGLIEPSTLVQPILETAPQINEHNRHSSFPATAHLHAPVLKLVSLHPFLSIAVSFLRTPEIHDGYRRNFFISKGMNCATLIEMIKEELGLTAALPVPGGGKLDYVLEEVWRDGASESTLSYPLCITG